MNEAVPPRNYTKVEGRIILKDYDCVLVEWNGGRQERITSQVGEPIMFLARDTSFGCWVLMDNKETVSMWEHIKVFV